MAEEYAKQLRGEDVKECKSQIFIIAANWAWSLKHSSGNPENLPPWGCAQIPAGGPDFSFSAPARLFLIQQTLSTSG